METNLEILNKLYEIGREVIDGLEIEDGYYTATELANRKDIRCLSTWNGQETYEIECGNFKCSFGAHTVFYIISKFERLCGLAGCKKVKFLRGASEDAPKWLNAMYLDRNGNAVCKKKKLIQCNDVVAVKLNKRYYEKDVYFRFGNVWYLVINGFSRFTEKNEIMQALTPENVKKKLDIWYENGYTSKYSPIYDALHKAMTEAN